MFDVGLIWERCPDGVEIHDYGNDDRPPMKGIELVARALLDQREQHRYGQYFRTRSDRKAPVVQNGIDLESPLVLQFVNTSSTKAIAAFLGEKGMIGETNEQSVKAINSLKDAYGYIVDEIPNITDGARALEVNNILQHVSLRAEYDYSGPNQSGRTVFYANNLGQYMAVEMAAAVMRNVGVVRCAYCGNAFFTGPAARRRSDAKTCSERCRSALRRRNATESA